MEPGQIAPTSSGLTLDTLGQLAVYQNGRPVTCLVLRKTQALLVYLALNSGPHARERLAGLLWGDQPDEAARRNLRHALSELRRCLGPTLLESDRLSVGLNPDLPCQVDVLRFEQALEQAGHCRRDGEPAAVAGHLETAVTLYRGAFLEQLDLPDCPEFDGWVVRRRAWLHGRALEALEVLAEHYTRRGEYEQALRHARQQLTLEPWWEAAHRQVMRLLALGGQRDAALRQYEMCRQLLKSELGLEPLEETTALHEQIKQGIGRSEWTEAGGDKTLYSLSLPFSGRAEEHARLVDWWERAQRGVGRCVLIEGEAGAGKTRLVEEVTGYAQAHGARVVRGRCYEFGDSLPYQPVTEALRSVLLQAAHPRLPAAGRGDPTPLTLDNLEPVWLAELSRLLPELRAARPDLPALPDVSGEAARQRLFEAVVRFLTLHPAPCVLFLDDLHWADQATLDLLHYLVRRASGASIGIIGAYRPEEVGPGHPLTRLRQGLSRDHLVERLTLGPLPAEAVTRIACAIVGKAQGTALGAFLQCESEGNPLVLVETVYALQEQGVLQPAGEGGEGDGHWQWVCPPPAEVLPVSVQDVILQRVERLSRAAQQLLTLASVVGRQFDVPLLQSAAGQDTDVVSACLDEWQTRRLVRPALSSEWHTTDGTPAYPGHMHHSFDFSHDKIRAVVYRAAVPERRRVLHGQVGQALEQLFPDRIEEQAGLLAYHWERAGDQARATEHLLRAGDQARLVYAHQTAVDYYRRALGFLTGQGEYERAARTLMKLGLTYHNDFDFRQARRAYDEGLALWQRVSRVAAAAPASQTLRVRWEEPTSLDPILSPDAHTSELMTHVFSALVELSPEMGIVPDVARSWQVSEDGCSLTFHLREDARWSDGTPVTAEDFAYAWRRALESPISVLTANSMCEIVGVRALRHGNGCWEDVGVRVPDPLTLQVELEVPAGYFLHLLAHTPYYPVPRHVVERHGDAWADPETMVTNGPFKLESWERGRCLVLKRHDGYHGHCTGNVLRVELYALPEHADRLQRYAADELDVLGITYFSPQEREAARQRYAGEYISAPRLCTFYLVFDVERSPFEDPRVRRALALATDREALADGVLQGSVSPATGGLVPLGMPGHSPRAGLPYDPERARRLLAEAGYPDGRGFPAVRALAFRAVEPRCHYLQAQWREQLGIEVVWEVVEWVPFLRALRESKPALFTAMWMADYPDPDNLLRVSRGDHWSAWRDETYDTLVERARRVLDQGARLALYAQAERVLTEEVPVLPLTYERDHLLIKPWVRRYPMSGSKSIFWKDVLMGPTP